MNFNIFINFPPATLHLATFQPSVFFLCAAARVFPCVCECVGPSATPDTRQSPVGYGVRSVPGVLVYVNMF